MHRYTESAFDAVSMRRLYEDKYMPLFASPAVQARLHRQHYHDMINRAREEELAKLGFTSEGEDRRQCWGYN